MSHSHILPNNNDARFYNVYWHRCRHSNYTVWSRHDYFMAAGKQVELVATGKSKQKQEFYNATVSAVISLIFWAELKINKCIDSGCPSCHLSNRVLQTLPNSVSVKEIFQRVTDAWSLKYFCASTRKLWESMTPRTFSFGVTLYSLQYQ